MSIDCNKYCNMYDDDFLVTVGAGECIQFLEEKGVLSRIANDLYMERCREVPLVVKLESQLKETRSALARTEAFIAEKQKDDSWSTSLMALKDKEIAWYRQKYNNEYALR